MHGDEHKRYQAIDRCLSYCVFTTHDTKEVWKKIRTRFPKSSRTKVIVAMLVLVIVQVIVTWLLRIWGQAG